jgi:glycogen debranching enzyme
LETYIKVGEDFYLLASSLASRRTTRVLAGAESFGIFDASGDISSSPLEPLGFFHSDTRFLSRFEMRIGTEFPHFLNSYLSSDNSQLRINLTNPDLRGSGDVIRLERDSIHIERSWVLLSPRLLHRTTVRNFSLAEVTLGLNFLFGCDFADLFEVRGVARKARGNILKPEITPTSVTLRYLGLDRQMRATRLSFSPTPSELAERHAQYQITLQPDQTAVIETEVAASLDDEPTAARTMVAFDAALSQRQAESHDHSACCARIVTSNESVNRLLRASLADLAMLTSHTPAGLRIMAGIPWFAALFGRDSLITALSMYVFNPRLAAGTLRTLAALQGQRIQETRDEEPGKIVHEVRMGEMARLGEVPFGRYYGSVDGTPLFLLLLGRYATATADLALAEELWPNVERALKWIEIYGDRDGDGYVEYQREASRGLVNQGWKDSHDSISHADGALAQPPIALCEVQAYVYGAYLAIAEVAARLGRDSLSAELEERAATLRVAFQRDFWLEKERTVALALDGNKRPCRVMASNAAHCLALGLLDPDQAEALGERLLAEDMFSGWGLRTLGSREQRFNPMSYHNGSVWPHDNAMAIIGLTRSRQAGRALQLATSLLEAAQSFDGSLPELFCGFQRETTLGPVPYPVACHPQAWSAASVFLLLRSILGLEIDSHDQRLVLDSPQIPPWLDWLRIDGVSVVDGSVSFLARRPATGTRAAIEILEKQGPVTVEIRN